MRNWREGVPRKTLGKIVKARFGNCGYQGAMFGLNVEFNFEGCAYVNDEITGFWNEGIKHTEYCKWTEDERSDARVEMIKRIDKILSDAKVDYVDQLVGKPVELELLTSKLVSWRILTEVI